MNPHDNLMGPMLDPAPTQQTMPASNIPTSHMMQDSQLDGVGMRDSSGLGPMLPAVQPAASAAIQPTTTGSLRGRSIDLRL